MTNISLFIITQVLPNTFLQYVALPTCVIEFLQIIALHTCVIAFLQKVIYSSNAKIFQCLLRYYTPKAQNWFLKV